MIDLPPLPIWALEKPGIVRTAPDLPRWADFRRLVKKEQHAVFPFLVVRPNAIASVVFTGTAVDATAQTTYTFAGVSIGANPSSTRFIVACFTVMGGTVGNITAANIGGVAATLLVANNAGAASKTAIYGALVPTGTTATITVTVAAAGARAAVAAYALEGLVSTTPTATASANSGNPMVNTLSSVLGGGVAIALACGNYANVAGTTWTGVTRDSDATTGGVPYSSASSMFTAPQTNLGANATLPGTPASQSSAAVSMR
jgi:hypothetical protein